MSIPDSLDNFFKDGKTIILPIDHGVAVSVPGLEKPADFIRRLNPFVDGYVVNPGVALACAEELKGKGICLRADAYNTRIDGRAGAGSVQVFGPETCLHVQATAMMTMLFPGNQNDSAILLECSTLIAQCLEAEIPVIVEALPYGLGQAEHYTCEKIGFAVRQAAELGATVVKTAFPVGASADDFARIVDACFVPVIILGGAALGDDLALLETVEKAIKAGAVGIAIGRNVWQHARPEVIARALQRVVHEGASAKSALGS